MGPLFCNVKFVFRRRVAAWTQLKRTFHSESEFQIFNLYRHWFAERRVPKFTECFNLNDTTLRVEPQTGRLHFEFWWPEKLFRKKSALMNFREGLSTRTSGPEAVTVYCRPYSASLTLSNQDPVFRSRTTF